MLTSRHRRHSRSRCDRKSDVWLIDRKVFRRIKSLSLRSYTPLAGLNPSSVFKGIVVPGCDAYFLKTRNASCTM